MMPQHNDLAEMQTTPEGELRTSDFTGTGFREDLAFPKFTEEMVARLKFYGIEEAFQPNTILYTHGDRRVDMFVVLEGGVDVYVTSPDGGSRIYGQQRKLDFTGEFNLLNSQGAVVEARVICDSRLLRITRGQLRRLMRAEGDIANLIVQAAVWRRIAILKTVCSGVVLVGKSNEPSMTELRRFFVRNGYPHRIVEVSPETCYEEGRLPYVQLADGRIMCRPMIEELADELGMSQLPEEDVTYDVAIVGAGPAGLASAVYAASEGLSTIVIEALAAGGQAGTSSKIENYLGFPTGIGGMQLASRAQFQALKFGAHFAIARRVVTSRPVDGIHQLTLAADIKVCARTIVVATGAQYRKLNIRGCERYENAGVFYACTPMEALLCKGNDVIVVGGGNSAGQASMFLSGTARHVYHIIRGASLASTMSEYLLSRLESSPHITLFTDSEIVSLEGTPTLESVTWVNRKTNERTLKDVTHIFVMIGAEPNTGWLCGSVKLDEKGFVLTGGEDGFEGTSYATSVPGIYAVGDVRAKSVKRVASAVGEGSVVISDVHRYLADHREDVAPRRDPPLAVLCRLAIQTKIASE